MKKWIVLFGVSSLGVTACSANDPGAEATEDDAVRQVTTVVNYDNFSDAAGYGDRWFSLTDFLGLGEPSISANRSITAGRLNLGATTFTSSYDLVFDHMKYFASSADAFDIPVAGSVMVSADISATAPGTVMGRVSPTTHLRLAQPQQAAAVLSMVDADDTLVHLSWWVSQNKAMAVYERLMPEGVCDLQNGFTQILGEVNLTPGTHNYAIEYRRTRGNSPDMVRWVVDGNPRFFVNRVGIPVDQGPGNNRPHPNFPSQGPGEELQTRLSSFVIGHGIGTMVDVFPFNQCPSGAVSIPASERAFGQGLNATFDEIRVTTVAHHNQ